MNKPRSDIRRELLALAKRQAPLAIDIRAALDGIRPALRDRAELAVQMARRLASELEELAADAAAIEARADRPILAAIEARAIASNGKHDAIRRNGKPPDWRSTPIAHVEGVTIPQITACRDSGIETAGAAWDQLDGGILSPHYWSHSEAKKLEAAIAALREKAGDPAPFTAAIPEPEPEPVELPDLDAPGGPDWRPAPEPPTRYIDVGNLPKPKRVRKSDRSFDVIAQAGGEWVARIWAERPEDAWGLANLAFPRLEERFEVRRASSRHSQDVINAGGKRLRRIEHEAFHMATGFDIGVPTGEPRAGGKTLEEQGYVPGVGEAGGDESGWPTFELLEKPGQPAPGHVRFRARGLVEAIQKASRDWPGMHVRPVTTAAR